MDWQTARNLIAQRIEVETDLNTTDSTYRKVLEYSEADGVTVQIGEKTSNKITILWAMLESCFYQLNTTEGYSGKYFRRQYKKQAKTHGCHVHVVGRIFVVAGLAVADESRYVSV